MKEIRDLYFWLKMKFDLIWKAQMEYKSSLRNRKTWSFLICKLIYKLYIHIYVYIYDSYINNCKYDLGLEDVLHYIHITLHVIYVWRKDISRNTVIFRVLQIFVKLEVCT